MNADAVVGNLVIEPGEHAPGATLDAAKLLARQTGGVLGVLEWDVEPGLLIPPHRHEYEDEIAYVVSGVIWWQLDDDVRRTVAGTSVWRPRGRWHGLWVEADAEPARFYEVIVPGGWDTVIVDLVARVQSGEISPEQYNAEALAHGVNFDVEWGLRLCEKYGVHLPA